MVREKEGAKKRREDVHSRRGAVPSDFGEGGSTVNVSGKRLRRRSSQASTEVSYGPPWARYLGGYQDRLLGGPLGLPGLRYTTPDDVKHKDYGGEVLG
jgi:hypothetical protein